MRARELGSALLLSLVFSSPVWAESETGWTQNATTRQAFRTSPIGLGLLAGDAAGGLDRAILVEGHNHLKQKRGFQGVRQYGQGQGRMEIGTGFGLTLASTTGVTLLGLDDRDSGLMPHFGIEPFSAQMSLNTNDTREDYYNWMPMAALGPQLGTGSCRLLPSARAGAGIGNIGKSGFAPRIRSALGASAYLNCATFDVALELTRMLDHRGNVDVALVDVADALDRRDDWKIGVRGESLMLRAPGASSGVASLERGSGDRAEQRAMLIVRSRAFSLN